MNFGAVNVAQCETKIRVADEAEEGLEASSCSQGQPPKLAHMPALLHSGDPDKTLKIRTFLLIELNSGRGFSTVLS